MLASRGAGADVVSGGELYLALRMGFPAEKIVFAGVGKTGKEMHEALEAGVRSFHVESQEELDALAQVARQVGRVASVAVRVNPDVDANTHPHITTGTRATKFGVAPGVAIQMVRQAAGDPWLRPVGLHAHIGSQLLKVEPIINAASRLLDIIDTLASDGIHLTEIDIGGGLGIAYRPEDQPEGPQDLAAGLRPLLAGRDLDLLLEPGRFLVGPAGLLLTTVLYTKQTEDEQIGEARNLAIVDAGMNDLLRPALYDAWHPVWPAAQTGDDGAEVYDIVGPVCESTDVLAQGREVSALHPGGLLAIGQAGAYGYSMSSQYNGRPRPAEVLVRGTECTLIRPRETYDDLWPAGEQQ
jgi:diaminopimelate decarboxylase